MTVGPWTSFAFAVIVTVACLYLPGYLLLRGLRCQRIFALLAAPLVSILCFEVLAIAYGEAGVPCSWVSVLAPVLVVGGLATALQRWKGLARGSHARANAALRTHSGVAMLALYVGVGCIVGTVVFLGNIVQPDAFLQNLDSVYHLNTLQAYSESGIWSPLHASYYLTPGDAALLERDNLGNFYPAAWHCLGALVINITGLSAPLVTTALAFTTASVLFPVSMLLLLDRLFGDNRLAIIYGALATVAFASYPWGLLTFGPIYPNLLSFALLPAVEACFIWMLTRPLRPAQRVLAAVLVVAGAAVLVFAQPNGIFSAIVFLTPFTAFAIWQLPSTEAKAWHKGAAAVGVIAFCAVVVAVWMAFFNAPFMQSIVGELWWERFVRRREAILCLLLLWYQFPAQWVLVLPFWAGVLAAARNRQVRFLVVSFAAMAIIYYFDAGVENTPLRQILTGFWYNDNWRISSSLSLNAIPLLALGFATLHKTIRSALRSTPFTSAAQTATALCVMAVAAFVNYAPSWEPLPLEPTTFTLVKQRLAYDYEPSSNVYDSDERAFVRQVRDMLPEGELVLNMPNDGSAYAYGADGLRTYFRSFSRTDLGVSTSTEKGTLVNQALDKVAYDTRVAQAVHKIGADYVLILDYQDSLDNQKKLSTIDYSDFAGIQGITDTTPGFEVVLSEGDMRLYRITDNRAA